MGATKHVRIAFTIFALVAMVTAEPDCQIFEEKDVVCTAGIDDYILRKGLVSDYSQATSITMRNCRITDIQDSAAFDNDFYVQYLDLSENKLTDLKLGVLDGTVLVKHLNLSYNMLTTLTTGLFSQKTNLEVLDLRGNRINTLPMDVFVPLRKLIYLDLSYNDFLGKDLSSYMFSKNRKIKHMDFSKNDMSNSPETLMNAFQELDFLNLERCSLKDVPRFTSKPNLRTLTHLTLATNQISRIDQARTFINLEKLLILNLAENLIEYVAINAFIYLKSVKVILLRNNRLKTIPDGFFRNLIHLENIDLSHNLLEHVSLNSFRGTALQDLDISDNRFSYLDAYFWVQLKNSGVKINKFSFDENPWQCACLNEILNEVKTYGVQYKSDRYNGQNPVCVTTKIFSCKRHPVDNQLFVEMYDNAVKRIEYNPNQ